MIAAALAKCQGGETVEVANITGPVTIMDRHFAKPVRLVGGSVKLASASGEDAPNLVISRCSGIILDDIRLEGAMTRLVRDGVTYDVPYGTALHLRDCRDVAVERCDLTNARRLLSLTRPTNVRVSECEFHDLGMDAITFGGAKGLLIEHNAFRMFNPLPGDHSDVIQCWSKGFTHDNIDVTIRGNLAELRLSHPTQGFFLGETVGAGHTGFVIEDNLIIDPAGHGITALTCVDPIIRGNRILSSNALRPWIKASAGAVVERNAAPAIEVAGKLPSNNDLSAGSERLAIDAAVLAWRAKFRPTPRSEVLASILADIDAIRARVAALA